MNREKTMGRGQAAAELLIVLAAALVIILLIFSYSSTSITDLRNRQIQQTAVDSVSNLKTAVNDVYAQGVGARKKVQFVVPGGVDSAKSFIQGKNIVLNVLGSDFSAVTDVNLTGTLPAETGSYPLWVTAHEGYVSIGTENILLDKGVLFASLSANSTTAQALVLTNTGEDTVAVTVTKEWNSADVNIELSTDTLELLSGQQATLTATFSSNPQAVGNKTGKLFLTSTTESQEDVLEVPVNVEIIQPQTNLILFPGTRFIALGAGQSDANSLQVCNGSESQTLQNITVTATGSIETWMAGIATIESLLPGACTTKTITLTVPGGQANGDYNGLIQARDNFGAGESQDGLAVTVRVQ